MKNEEAKQEAIKNAWKDLYIEFNNRECIDSNGYVNWGNYFIQDVEEHPSDFGFDPDKDIEWNGTKWRPVTLSGLHDNNGWTRIEPDGSNLPNESLDCKMIVSGIKDIKTGWFDTFLSKEKPAFLYKEDGQIWEYKYVTHYKAIEPELKPIY